MPAHGGDDRFRARLEYDEFDLLRITVHAFDRFAQRRVAGAAARVDATRR